MSPTVDESYIFTPKYSISLKLLENIKQISVLISELNQVVCSETVLVDLEQLARESSAHSSTSIEGNPLPLTEVKKILKNKPEHIRDTEREIVNYNEALIYLRDLKHPSDGELVNLKLVNDIQSKVLNKLLPKPLLGKLRKEAVFVNDPKLRRTVYWPPDDKDVKTLLTGLLKYINVNRDLDPIILSGIFHKQFVIIHPFIDGNGRTARLLTKYLLANLGLNTFPLFSFEIYYNRNVSKYFQMVGVKGDYYDIYKDIDFTEWLEYFSDGVIDELLRVGAELKQRMALITKNEISQQNPDSRLEAYHELILKYIKEHGYINDKFYSALTERAKATRSLDFKKLMQLGLIKRYGQGRATYYK